MIPIIVSEFKLWHTAYRRTSMGILVIFALLFGCLSGLSPEFFMIGIALALFWLGIEAGDQVWSEVNLETWFHKTNLSPGQIVIGKILAIAIIVLYHDFFLLPITFLMVVLWGIDGLLVFEANAMIMVFTLVIYTLGLICRTSVYFNLLINKAILCIWLVITFTVPALRWMNPFYQLWMISSRGAHLQLWLSIAANLGLLLMIIGVLFFLLRREVRGNGCQANL